MEKRESFDSAAKVYDESRPSYPDPVIDWIVEKTGVEREGRLLEIGPGTGQATMKFAERGYKIHCVEMGKNLADLLIQKTNDYDVTVDVSSFENWEPLSPFRTSFIYCATAFHWIDPKVGYKKCWDMLDDNGYLVLIWNVAGETNIEEEKKAYDLLWEYYPERKNVAPVDIKSKRKTDIINSGLFELEDYLDYKWKVVNTKEKLTKGFFSQSSYLALEKEKQEILGRQVEELFGGVDEPIETDFYTTVYIAKKK